MSPSGPSFAPWGTDRCHHIRRQNQFALTRHPSPIRQLVTQVARREKRVALLQTIPGIWPMTASAIVATVGTAKQFGNGRDFAAWLGLTPLNRSSGGKERLGRISKMGDRYIRRLLVLGMMSRMRQITSNPERYDPWFADILARKPGKVAAFAITAREGRIKLLVSSGPS
jgi:transposase